MQKGCAQLAGTAFFLCIFMLFIELASFRVLPIVLSSMEMGIHSYLKVLQTPTGYRAAAC
jgi:hypothetical protein